MPQIFGISGLNSCFRKRRYRSFELAEAALRRAEHERGTKLRIYNCEICMGYHLTKRYAAQAKPKDKTV